MAKPEYSNRPLSPEGQKTMFFASVGASVRDGLPAHQFFGLLATTKKLESQQDPQTGRITRRVRPTRILDEETGRTGVERPWGNIAEMSLVQVARTEVLGRWLDLPEDVIKDAKMGSFLHNVNKKEEIRVTREANAAGTSPLAAVKSERTKIEEILTDAAFSDRVISLASAPRGYAPQLLEVHRILEQQESLSDDDLAYLAVHYVSDLATGRTGTDWVRPSYPVGDGQKVNEVDYRAEENNRKTDYTQRIIHEITDELQGSPYEGMNTHNVMAILSHRIENVLAQRIQETTGETVDPFEIPELIDQKIKDRIAQI